MAPELPARSAAPDIRLIRLREVQHLTGISRTRIYMLQREENFPAPVRLHGRAIAWIESEVLAWIAGRPRVTRPTRNTNAPARSAEASHPAHVSA